MLGIELDRRKSVNRDEIALKELSAKVSGLKSTVERLKIRRATEQVDAEIANGTLPRERREWAISHFTANGPAAFEKFIAGQPVYKANPDGTFVRINAATVAVESLSSVEQKLCKHFRIEPEKFVAMRKRPLSQRVLH
jgi:hypothetical protein